MKTGLPRHLMMTCMDGAPAYQILVLPQVGIAPVVLTFLPSGIDARSTSTLAMAKTSADADMFFRNSVRRVRQRQHTYRIIDAAPSVSLLSPMVPPPQLTPSTATT